MNFDPELMALLPIWYIAFLFSLTCHEAAHALAAKWGGDLTAYHAGQVTLNPMPHMQREMFGTTIVPLLTFLLNGWMIGWGSAPYDPYWEHRHPKRAAAMALAGPIANLVLVLASLLIIVGLSWGGILQAPAAPGGFTRLADGTGNVSDGFATFLSIMFSLNLLLALFNLLPLAPLDGHSAIGLILPEETHQKFLAFIRQPMPSLIGLVIAWNYFGELFWPVYVTAVHGLFAAAGFTG